ncbi:DNA mismatch repair protein MutS [Anaerolineales bacterium HSG24]|nr:DNA mismatch repair protein MutS [Anaerolineales bacterium HSG24]
MTTPLRRQYLQIKQNHPDAILFFRMGDFYECFDDDAKTIAHALNLTLTSRQAAKGKPRIPMAGVPYHAADGYIARLVKAGYKVAICEQVGDQPKKGPMHREVKRVVTAGTVVEDNLLTEDENNYLLGLILHGQQAGLAYVDITTGQFAATELHHADIERVLLNEINRLKPAEIIMPDEDTVVSLTSLEIPHSPYETWHFELEQCDGVLKRHFGVATLDGFGLNDKSLAVRAAGAVIQYVSDMQKAALAQIIRLKLYSINNFMALDAATRRNLELTETIRSGTKQGSLLDVLDQTVTPMGGRLLRQWLHQPLLQVEPLNQRLDAVDALREETLARNEIRQQLKAISDVERLTNRLGQGLAQPRDLLALRRSLEAVPYLESALITCPSVSLPDMLDSCPDLIALIERSIVDDPPALLSKGGVIRSGYSVELDGLLTSSREAKDWVANLEIVERKRTGIKNLKVGFNKVFGYYLEVTHANRKHVPDDYIRKQTLTNAERYITPELKEYETLILNAEEREGELETRLFKELCTEISHHAERLLTTSRAVAYLDTVSALAEVALRNNYVRPTLSDDDRLEVVNGRHPVVERMALFDPDGAAISFVPNDVTMSKESLVHIITGPNASGKSTYLRQTALLVLLAQIGSFVPADSAHIGLVDRIFTRIGAQDEIHAGQSTFMVEMVETAAILTQSSNRSLIILDEVGRGTSTYDGLAIARSVVEYIHNNPKVRAKTLFATHYHELTELTNYLPHVRNYNVAVKEEGHKVIFLHKILPGGADRSYGIYVAQIAGVPKSIIDRANQILQELESNPTEQKRQKQVRQAFSGMQLSFIGEESHPVVDELRQLDVDALSPLEALNQLYTLKQQVEK